MSFVMEICGIKLRSRTYRAELRSHTLVGEALAHPKVHGESRKACSHMLEIEATRAMLGLFRGPPQRQNAMLWCGSAKRSS